VLARAITIAAALCLGWVIYMIGMLLTVYDGVLSLIFQPFMAALASGLTVGLALLAGVLLRIPILSRWWSSTALWAGLLGGISLFVLAFGYSLGLTYVGTNPETGNKVLTLHPTAAVAGYFFLLFAVANWPVRRRRRHINQPYNRPLERTGGAGRSTPSCYPVRLAGREGRACRSR